MRIVRVTYPDLHGVLRGKDVPIGFFAANVLEDGLGFCKAISTVDLQHNVVAGFEHGFRDIHVWPLPETLVRLPWAPEVAWCLADQTADGEPYGADPRATLKRAMAAFGELGLEPVMGPELEFYLLERERDGLDRLDALRREPDARLHRRRPRRPARHPRPHAALAARRRARRDRRRARVRHEPVGDQPHALQRARRGRPRVPLQGRGQGSGHARRHACHVHGQAVQRRRRLGLPPAPLALRRGRRQRLRRRGRRRGLRRAAAPLHRGRDRPRTGPDGDPQPDRQRLPAHRPPRARPDARLLGLRQPLRARARAARARRRDARRDAARRRRRPTPTSRLPPCCSPGSTGSSAS